MAAISPNDAPVRKILHVDADSFYASVEVLDDPSLKGKPLAVGGSKARSVVATASYEARKFGVRSAMPSLTAAKLCPGLIFVRPRFERYREVSRQMRMIFADYTSLIEPLSLDEAYLDVTDNLRGIALPTDVATEIRDRIRSEIGVTVSAGVAYNKFLAKQASDERKPDGQFVFSPKNGPAYMERLAVERFHGNGPATADRMRMLDIRTGLDLKGRSIEFLTEHFGKSGAHFHALARGIDLRPVVPNRERKSVGVEHTYDVDIRDAEDVHFAIGKLASDLVARCGRHGVVGRTLTAKIKLDDFEQLTRSLTDVNGFSRLEQIAEAAARLVRDVDPQGRGIRLLGLSASNFGSEEKPETDGQLRLF